MTIFRSKKNGLLYTITRSGRGANHKAHPFMHDTDIGVKHKRGNRYQDFKSNMTLDDFIPAYYC